jgi:hypothetical protein
MSDSGSYILLENVKFPKDEGWSRFIADRLPEQCRHEYVQYCEDLFTYPDLSEVAGIVVIGTMVWDDNSAQDDNVTLRLLHTLHERGYDRTVVYLTDRLAALDDKTPYEAAFPGVKVLSKTAVDNGSMPLPF